MVELPVEPHRTSPGPAAAHVPPPDDGELFRARFGAQQTSVRALRDVLEAVDEERPPRPTQGLVFRLCLEAGVIVDNGDVVERRAAAEAELHDAGSELEELRRRRDESNARPEIAVVALKQRVEETGRELETREKEFQQCVRDLRNPLVAAGRMARRVASWVPIVNLWVQPPGRLPDLVAEAGKPRREAMRANLTAQLGLVEAEIRIEQRNAEREDLDKDIARLETQRDAAETELHELGGEGATRTKLFDLTPRGRVMRIRLAKSHNGPAQDDEGGAVTLLERASEAKRASAGRIAEAGAVRKALEGEHGYHPLAAELVSWFMVNAGASSPKALETFRAAHETVGRVVEPSYTQLLLTLRLQATGDVTFAALERLSNLSNDLPNFSAAERLLVALDKGRIEGAHDGERQERLMRFVDLLTGPIGEHLSGLERYQLAARLGAQSGDSVLVAERFAVTFKALRDAGLPATYRTSLAALTLTHSTSRGDARMRPFTAAQEAIREVDASLVEPWLLESAVVALLPGPAEPYVDTLLTSREALIERGCTPEQATALALPASLVPLTAAWNEHIREEAFQIGQRVSELDDELLVPQFRDHREQIRRARLEEEILGNLQALQRLYSGIGGLELNEIWRTVAEAAAARDVVERDALHAERRKAVKAGEGEVPAARSAAERLTRLLEREDALRSRLRELTVDEEGA